MRYLFFLLIAVSSLSTCDSSSQIIDKHAEATILPYPKEISNTEKQVVLSESSQLYANDEEVLPLLETFQKGIEKTLGIQLSISEKKNANVDILFELDSGLRNGTYELDINHQVTLKASDYASLAMGSSSLLQLAQFEEGKLSFPVLKIRDYPDASYRGLMIDLARNWHPLETVKQLIDLAAFYRINYLHLHFTDYQSYTLPSKKYPKLSTPERTYSLEELREMEAYAQARGITIIPEIDVPGHSSPFVKAYPEIFAIDAVDENPYIINMGVDSAYIVLDELIGEICQIFTNTPYFHIGGDEAYFHKVIDDEKVLKYMQINDLGEDVHELYRHFIVRMNEIVKKHGKQMCVWEGFRPDGNITIPKDILVFEFETNRYLPGQLVADGYTVINTSWKPLYVVNQKKWSPKTIYDWNLWRWENWWSKVPSYDPIQLEPTPLIQGAEMCAWEQKASMEIPSLRKRLPAFSERVWNVDKSISYGQMMDILNEVDEKFSKLIGDTRQDSLLIDYDFKEEDLQN